MLHMLRNHLSLAAHSLPHLVVVALLAAAPLVSAHAAATPEQKCQQGRYDGAAKYSACMEKALAKFFGGSDLTKLNATSRKCRAKYWAVWPKLQAKTPGSTCDTQRFTDNGTTVTDNLTALQWVKTTDDGSVHDKDNFYSWSTSSAGVANGTLFTTYLATVNTGACFESHCDWRLPTILELLTIVLPDAVRCTPSPCIDPIFDPILGPPVAGSYWSSTKYATVPNQLWGVNNQRELQDFNVSSSFITGKLAR